MYGMIGEKLLKQNFPWHTKSYNNITAFHFYWEFRITFLLSSKVPKAHSHSHNQQRIFVKNVRKILVLSGMCRDLYHVQFSQCICLLIRKVLTKCHRENEMVTVILFCEMSIHIYCSISVYPPRSQLADLVT